MSDNYGIPEQVINNIPILGYVDDSGITRLSNNSISSNNFDGFINKTGASVAVSDVTAGNAIGIVESGSISFYPIISVFREDPDLETGSYTGYHEIQYLVNDELLTASYSASNTVVQVLQEDWDNKYLGTSGWVITQEGNAIFSNIAARGRIEATSGYIGDVYSGWEIGANLLSNASVGFYAPSAFSGTDIAIFSGSPFANRATAPFRINYAGQMFATGASISGALTATTLDVGGANGIIYNGSAVTIGASVTINAPVTVNSLQVGASPTLLRIADDVQGTNDGIYINANNYWYSDGQFSVGGSANNAVWSGSALTVTGDINATTITSSVGNIAGFILSDNQLGTASVIVSSSGGLRLGNPVVFSVDQFGNLVATSASITGNITANSGTFTGSITAQHITASIGEIAGFTLSKSQLSTASVIVSSSGGFRLGNPTVFSVDQFGNLVATSASITGDINATSGSFSGKITATTGTIGGWELGSTTLTGTSASLDSAGKVVVGSNQNVAAMSGTDTNRIWAGSAVSTNAPFRVSAIGGLVATSASIIGDVTAQSGKFTGGVTIETGGSLTAGTGAQNVSIDSTGLYGYNPQGLLAFKIPTDGTDPLIAQFKILETGLVSNTSETGANLIVGDVSGTGSAASVQSGIVIRGYRSLNASVAIYTVQGGSATTYTQNNGIYLDETGKFKIKGATGSIAFDGDDLYISGNVNARSGNFSGSIQAQHITASVGSIAGFTLSNNQMSTASVVVSSSGGFRLGNPTIFSVDQFGNLRATSASITGNITANSGQFTGSVVAQHITASIGNIGGWNLAASALTGNSASLDAKGSLTLGSGQTVVALSSTDTNRIWAGSAVSTTAPFRVSGTGFLTATGASITGNITAQSGQFTGSVSAQHITASTGTVGGFTLSRDSISATNLLISTASGGVFTASGASSTLSIYTSSGIGIIDFNTKNNNYLSDPIIYAGKLVDTYPFIIITGFGTSFSDNKIPDIPTTSPYIAMTSDGGWTGGPNSASTSYVLIGAPRPTSEGLDPEIKIGGEFVQIYADDVRIGPPPGVGTLKIDTNVEVISGNFAVDTNTLFVDATNNEVGIGTITPASALHVAGGLLVNNNASVGGIFSTASINIGGSGSTLYVAGNAFISNNLNVDSGALYVDGSNGNVGIGLTNPNTKFTVLGAASVTGNLNVGGTITGTSTTQSSGNDTTSLATTAFVSRMVKYNGAPSPNTSSVAGFFVLAVNPGTSINGFVVTPRGTASRVIVAALDVGINGAASAGYVRGYVETNAGVAVAVGNSVPLSYIAW